MAATASHCGKTTACLGLLCALRARGIPAQAAKAGPDYIDRSWLARASGQAAPNLDLWMSGLPGGLDWLDRLLLSKSGLLVLEGAMGLYDGHRDGVASCAHLASFYNLPICLLLNVEGMGQSVAALAQGFLEYQPPNLFSPPAFLGLICVRSGSASHERLLAEALAPVLEAHALPLFGFLSKRNAPCLPERHLGLVQAEESGFNFGYFAKWFEAHCNLDAMLERLRTFFPKFDSGQNMELRGQSRINDEPRQTEYFIRFNPLKNSNSRKLVVAIAHDAAFSFIYADLPALLEELGAKVVFFSLLADSRLEDCDAIYLPGGYPELFAPQLARNKSLIASLRSLAQAGVPIFAECGGFIYLGRELRGAGETRAMANLVPLAFEMTGQLQELGYREACLLDKSDITVRGHVFHYARICEYIKGNLWKMDNGKTAGWKSGLIWGSWLHLYPAASRDFWQYWLKLALERKIERDSAGKSLSAT